MLPPGICSIAWPMTLTMGMGYSMAYSMVCTIFGYIYLEREADGVIDIDHAVIPPVRQVPVKHLYHAHAN